MEREILWSRELNSCEKKESRDVFVESLDYEEHIRNATIILFCNRYLDI